MTYKLLSAMKKYRFRLIFTGIGLLLIAIYKLISLSPRAARYAYLNVIRPFHMALASLCDRASFAVCELMIVLLVIGVVTYLAVILVYIIQKVKTIAVSNKSSDTKTPMRLSILRCITSSILSICLTFIMLISLIYGAFCVLWGFYYYAPSVSEVCGIEAPADGISHEDLLAVDEYFLQKANEYSKLVTRDDNGCYKYDKYGIDGIIEHSLSLYDAASDTYPALACPSRIPKGISFSNVLSYMDFTGFYSPFTGEACYNTDSPACMVPSTIAHELAHARGIGAEDEANFIAVMASLEDGDADYVYSASLLALIHLQNAVYKSGDMEAWQNVKDRYSEGVAADIAANSEYWSYFKSSAAHKVSVNTYDAFLKSYDQTLGRATYGACVDLLVTYYINDDKLY